MQSATLRAATIQMLSNTRANMLPIALVIGYLTSFALVLSISSRFDPKIHETLARQHLCELAFESCVLVHLMLLAPSSETVPTFCGFICSATKDCDAHTKKTRSHTAGSR
jgi:hypothetical protein